MEEADDPRPSISDEELMNCLVAALGHLLEENEGIVIDSDLIKCNDAEEEKYLVVKSDGKIRILSFDEDYPDGQLVWYHPDTVQ